MAVCVGGLLRLAWVVIVTRAPVDRFGDAAEYLRLGDQLSRLHLPTFHFTGPSAFFPVGYPLVLSPFLLLARASGLASPAFTASLVNAAAGTLTVACTGLLAAHWVSSRAGVLAAWLTAVCPAHIYFTSTAHSETVGTALAVMALLHVCRAARRHDTAVRPWIGLGVLVGLAALARGPGLVLLIAPALAVRADAGAWRYAGRATAAVAFGAALLLVPWAVRNGVQTGAWTPLGTNNALAVCLGNNRDAVGTKLVVTPAVTRQCGDYSLYNDPRLGPRFAAGAGSGAPDEGRWYTSAMRRASIWALSHPMAEARLVVRRAASILSSEWDALPGARSYDDEHWAGRLDRPLQILANAWLFGVEALVVVGLVRSSAARRARPILVLGALWLAPPLLTLGIPQFRHAAVPMMVVVAAAALSPGSDATDGSEAVVGVEGRASAVPWGSVASDAVSGTGRLRFGAARRRPTR